MPVLVLYLVGPPTMPVLVLYLVGPPTMPVLVLGSSSVRLTLRSMGALLLHR